MQQEAGVTEMKVSDLLGMGSGSGMNGSELLTPADAIRRHKIQSEAHNSIRITLI